MRWGRGRSTNARELGVTPDDIDWPPPICGPCRWGLHDHCQPDALCECLVTYCYERLLEPG